MMPGHPNALHVRATDRKERAAAGVPADLAAVTKGFTRCGSSWAGVVQLGNEERQDRMDALEMTVSVVALAAAVAALWRGEVLRRRDVQKRR